MLSGVDVPAFRNVKCHKGSATASAAGAFGDDQGSQRAFFWSEPVRLTYGGAK